MSHQSLPCLYTQSNDVDEGPLKALAKIYMYIFINSDSMYNLCLARAFQSYTLKVRMKAVAKI